MAVHVGNIPVFVDEDDLVDFLEKKIGDGTVFSCKINLHPDSARSKGFGFVCFKDKEKAAHAVKLSRDFELLFHNHTLELTLQDRDSRVPPELFVIQHGKLSIGCLKSVDLLHSMWSHSGRFVIEFSQRSQMLAIRLRRRERETWLMEYKMEFLCKEIKELVPAQVSGKRTGMLLQIKERPPYLYFRRVDDPVPTGDAYVDMLQAFMSIGKRKNIDDENFSWTRTTDFTPNVIGQSFVYVLELHGPEAPQLEGFLKKTGVYSPICRNIKIKVGEPYAGSQVVVPLLNPKMFRLPFEHLFKINNLVQMGKVSGPNLNEKFFRLVKESNVHQVSFALQAMSSLEDMCYDPVKFFKEQLEAFKKVGQVPVTKLEKGQAWIHRLLVTPTKVYCVGPEVETSNRIVRQYENLASHFLRVNFVDENCAPLMSTALIAEMQTSRSDLFKRISFIMNDGLFIGYRNYDFLAFSASQLREGQLWMFAPKGNQDCLTADAIREGMGDFSKIRNPAKHAARMGQCFSSSRETQKVLPRQVKRIKDITIKTGSTEYCFSDGIGKISQDFACKIALDCGLPPGHVPSAFQIRYGGHKGVVAVDPTEVSSFKLYLRPSMDKFFSKHMSLEVLDWTKSLPCHLNRQVISLLSTLGVNDAAFLNLQDQVVSKYERMLEDDALAMEILQEVGSDPLPLKMLKAGPHPNECSGSDLDGDKYVVSWDESLVPPTTDPAMDYSAPPAIVLDHPVELNEIQEFFVNYMVNDNLGVIANAHVVHADKEPDKARSPKCLELAMLASMAVDFPKTGVPAVIPMALRPREYPDFMEKSHKTTYISHGVIGKLYRSINPITPRDFGAEMTDCLDKDLIVPGAEKFLENAQHLRKLYDIKLIGLMNQYGIREEAEIVGGCVLSMSELYQRAPIDALPKVRLAFRLLQKEAATWFYGSYGKRLDQEDELPKASAWYQVTYDFAKYSPRDALQHSKVTGTMVHLVSFPWAVSDILLSLKQRVSSTGRQLSDGSMKKRPQSSLADTGASIKRLKEMPHPI